ncbi:MAG: lanthionine synthetase LanC family protein [Flavobacterium sp.]|uniref:lanthionine synthetase LanC family protein n=1 Tax=Flavobacterium sp. TaxID=239 RepID=UPI003266A638
MLHNQPLTINNIKYTLDDIENNISVIIEAIDQNIELFDDASSDYGTMGLAIFYFYCHQYFKDEKYLEKGEQLINLSIVWVSSISQENYKPKYKGDSLSNVISSFGKGLLFIQYHWNYEYNFEDFYTIIEDTLELLTEQSLKEKDFDYFSGALSAGHFHLNKYYYQKDEKSKLVLQKIYSAIHEYAIYHTPNEIYWKSSAVYNNLVYLGISHGCSMILNFISKIIQLGVIKDDNLNQNFLNKAVNLVMSKKRNISTSYFPNFFSDEEFPKELNTIFGITYGDLGVLYALYNANKILKNSILELEITDMLVTSAERKMDLKFTYDAGVMYGASGIFSAFKELYQTTDIPIYKECYQYWYGQIMELRNLKTKEKAGYTFVCTPKDLKKSISDEFSLGWGLAGVGISLLIGIDSSLPSIDELGLLGKLV